jgi:hypothetical protein
VTVTGAVAYVLIVVVGYLVVTPRALPVVLDALAEWAVPDGALMEIGFVPGCSCLTCVPECPSPALRYLLGAAA